jgi:Fe-coproporphyrin III synthase
LVVEVDGTVVPLEFGFRRDYALGNLTQRRLGEMVRDWRAERYPAFQDLCRRALAELETPAALPFVNWYETLAEAGAVTHD